MLGERALARLAALASAPACCDSISRRTRPQTSSIHAPVASAVQVCAAREPRVAEPVPETVGIEAGARLGDQRQRLTVIGLVGLDRLVGDRDRRLQPFEFGIVENRPPRALRLRCRAGARPSSP